MTLRMTFAVFLAATALAIPVASAAQDQASASPQLTSEPSPRTERNITESTVSPLGGLRTRVQDGLDQLNTNGISPKIGSIVSGSGIAFGVGLRADRFFGRHSTNQEFQAMWSFRGYQRYEALIGSIEHRRRAVGLRAADENVTGLFADRESKAPGNAAYLAVAYRRSPQLDYFALDGPKLPPADFAVTGTSFDGVIQWQPTENVGLAMRAGLLNLALGPGTRESTPNIETRLKAEEALLMLRQPRYLTAGIAAVADTRNNSRAPTSGRFLGLAVWRFVPLDAEAESFTRLAADWRTYRSIGSDRHVAAIRLLASTDTSAARSSTPVYLLYWLGGSNSLRGFPSYRFRGSALAHLSIEYRWRAARRVEIAPFIDVGAVAARLSQISRAPFKVSPGIGVRIRNDDRILFRVDWARGSEGHRVLFSLSPAF